jgi:hypothetical protein
MNKFKAIKLAGGRKQLAELLTNIATGRPLSQAAISQWGDELPQFRVWQLRILKPDWF